MVSGSNQYGQLGFPKEEVPEYLDVPKINLIMSDDGTPLNIVDIACGSNHTMVLGKTPAGSKILLVFGNEVGLGFGDLQDRFTPTVQKITEDYFGIERIHASFNRSIAYDDEGKIYIWGEDFWGDRIEKPQLLHDFNTKLISFSVGYLHALAVTDTFEVYSWGDGSYGELGHGDSGNRQTPTKIQYFSDENIKITKVAAGTRFSVILDSKGNIYTFGCNSVKECGREGERFNTPGRLDIFTEEHTKGFEIFAGYSHAACITSIVMYG